MVVEVTAMRTHCSNKQKKLVSVTLVLRSTPSGPVVAITEGGVTGYEAFYLNDWKQPEGAPWCACWGTENVWDRLEIPGHEMDRALIVFREE